MARPRKNILTVTKILADGTWRLVCGRAPHRIKISIQHLVNPDNPVLAEMDAERFRLELAAARARDDWPPWARKTPSVQRLLVRIQQERLNGPPPAGIVADSVHPPGPATGARTPDAPHGGVYDLYNAHLKVSVSPSWRSAILAFLRELADTQTVPLLHAEPSHVQNYLDHILQTPGPREWSVHEAAVQRWRRNQLRSGIDPDTGKPLDAFASRPPGPRSKRASETKPTAPRPRTIATRNQALRCLRQFFEWAIRQGVAESNPTAGIRKLQEPPPEEVVVLSIPERVAFLEAAKDEPDGLGIAIGLYAGLRRAEVIRADWKHIRLDQRKLRVPRYKKGGEQTPRVRTVPISQRLFDLLSAVPEKQRQGKVMDWPEGMDARRKAAGNLMVKLAGKPKLSDIRREKFDWRVLRHTFCTGHLDAGVTPGVVCQWSGHTEKVFWQNYAGHIREYDERIDLIDREPESENDPNEAP